MVSLVGMLTVDQEPLFTLWTSTTWVLAVSQALLAQVGTICILTALRTISPTKNKVIRSFQVVLSYIIQVGNHSRIT